MLTTETFTVDDAVDELSEQIDALDDALDEYEAGTEQANALQNRTSKLSYWQEGLKWHLAEGDWDADTELTLGAMTAGEEAMLHREMPTVDEEDEYRLWWVAGSTETAPYLVDDLEDTFANLAGLHPAVPKYLEAKANSLGIASDEGNEPATSSEATETSAASTTPSDSTT
jgi:hypothetical protein